MQPMIATLLLFAAPATAQEAPPPNPDRDIVVTGVRLEDTRKALESCLAQHCSPREDMAATLAHTENLFVAGKYQMAHRVVSAGVDRNRRYGRELPREVAGLLRAHARLSGTLGDIGLQRSSTLDLVSVLKSGLPANTPDIQIAQIELADVYGKNGNYLIAEANYRQIEADARAAGNLQAEGYARFRRGVMLLALSETDGAFRGRARDVLQDVARSTVPEHAVFVDGARIGLGRIAARQSGKQGGDQMLANMPALAATTRPTLIYGEPIRLNVTRLEEEGGSVTRRLATDSVEDQWIDVTFMIDRDGKPQDIEAARTSAGYSGDWADKVIESVQSRRYAPLKLAAGTPGLFRVERYTKTAPFTTGTGTRIRQRSTESRVEMIDLSIEPAAPLGTPMTGSAGPAA
ncbi:MULTISPECIES: hypothetical protein [unclassified Sphingomonas]|uniref:hypothetical protein n=1 Tax=unclassified Sphingomonas TaxID=196159 RepID=UPI0006F76360|nr:MULTISPECIES: hypothetical protein [unclassified Sphingomonas]